MPGLYLHIPFCRKACAYCNFHFSTTLRGKEEVLKAMHTELAARAGEATGQPIHTLYFGGGTPSLLTPHELLALTDAIARHYDLSALQECTLEANPDDLTPAHIRALRATPINRLSIGVQSFRDEDLRYMNRAHNAAQSEAAIKAAQDAGFTNLSIDLIYGTPGLSDADWSAALNHAQALGVPHLSAYALTVEEGTALHHAIEKKKTRPVLPEAAAAQFDMLAAWAQAAGYEHYEISNLAKPGCYAMHNTAYWQGTPYIGIGPSAHSFDGARRSWNISNNALYAGALLRDGTRLHEEETLSPADRLNEYLMTSLRTQWGCDLEHVAREFGEAERKRIVLEAAPVRARSHAVLDGEVLKLTQAGRHFADRIAGELFVDK